MWLTLGVDVITKIDHVVTLRVEDEALFFDDAAQIERLGDEHTGLIGKGTAGIQTDDGLVGAEGVIADEAKGLEIILLDLLATGKVDGNLRGLLKGMGQVDLALMRGWLLAQEDSDDGLGAFLEQIDDLIADCRRGRLRDDANDIRRLVILEADDGILDGGGTDRLVEVAATCADGMDQASTKAIDDGSNLLDARAGSSHDTDIAGLGDIGERNGYGGDDARAAIRPHEHETLLVCTLLQANLILEGDVVGEGEDVQSLVEGFLDLGSGVLARRGEEGEVGIGKGRECCVPAVNILAVEGLLLNREVGKELLYPSENDIDDPRIIRVNNDDHITGAGSLDLGGKQPRVLKDILISVGPHHDLAFRDVLERVDLVGEQHQIDRVLIAVLLDDGREHSVHLSSLEGCR